MNKAQDNSLNLAPFSCSYSPNVPELLWKLQCSLAISTYQAGKVIFLSPQNEEHLVQLPRTFEKPMGIALANEAENMAVACKEEVIVFANSRQLAATYPKRKNTYDALYFPRCTFHIGQLDIHDLSWGESGLFAVNTLFSCIIKIDDQYNFVPYWTPPFISTLSSEDRCHLNGMVMLNGRPKYATAFNQGNSFQSWREVVVSEGILMDVETNEVIFSDLRMPHSPRLINNELYILYSATGELVKLNPSLHTKDVICRIDGFVRGMAYYQDFIFIGLSRLRQNSSTFSKLEIAGKSKQAGIVIIHLPTASRYGEIWYNASVDEIYDIQVLPDKLRPNIFNTVQAEHKKGLSIPGATYWADLETEKS